LFQPLLISVSVQTALTFAWRAIPSFRTPTESSVAASLRFASPELFKPPWPVVSVQWPILPTPFVIQEVVIFQCLSSPFLNVSFRLRRLIAPQFFSFAPQTLSKQLLSPPPSF
jgi:hypothetical protein